MQSLRRTVLAVLALWCVGAAAAFLFAWNSLDEGFDLWALFQLRGARPAPGAVLVVGLDQEAVTQSGLSISAPREWPRSKHAQLIDTLKRAGARAIVVDLEFHKWRGDADDVRLAASIRDAGNVVLVAGLEQQVTNGPGGARQLIERLRELPAEFRTAAAAVAPFTLPRRPPRVNSYETFRQAAGDTPGLPLAALYVYARAEHELLGELAVRAQAGIKSAQDAPRAALVFAQALARSHSQEQSIVELRRLFSTQPALTQRVAALIALAQVTDDQRRVLRSLLDLYAGEAHRYLQFYGPPGTVRVVSYEQALTQTTAADWRGKAVFVGWMREQEKDIYYTAFSGPEGGDLTGVEIAATAFANLLHDKPVRPVQGWRQILLLLVAASVLGALAMNLRAAWVAPLLALLALGYVALALRQFDARGLWLPLLVPLFVQAPLAVGLAWWRRTRDLRKVANALSRVMQNRLPREVAERMARALSPDLRAQEPEQWLMYGTCLHTDVSGYTRIAHSLTPEELFRIMQNYFRELEQIVTQHGGFVVDRAGDSMLALWASATPDRAQRASACHAALAMARISVERLQPGLPTRIGLDTGQLSLGFIGSTTLRDFRAFGDIVNTSQRVQEKNKPLGTWVLATEAVLEGVDDVLTRPVGTFELRGRQGNTKVFELMTHKSAASQTQTQLAADFAQAVQAHETAQLARARELFTELNKQAPEDGPTLYYLEHLWEQGNSSKG